tara:strand:- start:2972 stop:3964 length:993 start_codon:yes stop_codon:yes gene_type:complete
MSGGIAQLVSIGAQDVHLVGKPEVSFFRTTYRRHTNFAMTNDRQVIQGSPSAGGTSTINIERRGDMLSYMYLRRKDGGDISANDIEKVEILIGGQVIDEQDFEFSRNIADDLLVNTPYKPQNASAKFYPLHFWFCENWQSALPLVSLQYHNVDLRITWGSVPADVYECWARYIYLDTDERTTLANNPQDMLIYQVQKTRPSGKTIQDLVFNHPVKFIACSNILPANTRLKLQINGVDVDGEKELRPHFNDVPVYYHTTHYNNAGPSETYLLYPFCLDTNKLQPTGTLNFSRLDTARFVATTPFNRNEQIYAVNYNILKIRAGMASLAYAN